MEPEVIKVILSSLGGGGVAVLGCYFLFKAYTENVKATLQMQAKQIDSLELRSKSCEEDRIAMRQEIIVIQRDVIIENNRVLEQNRVALDMLTELAKQNGPSMLNVNQGQQN